jgi:hypothetical protein
VLGRWARGVGVAMRRARNPLAWVALAYVVGVSCQRKAYATCPGYTRSSCHSSSLRLCWSFSSGRGAA